MIWPYRRLVGVSAFPCVTSINQASTSHLKSVRSVVPDAATVAASGTVGVPLRRDRRSLFVVGVRLQHQFADAVLCVGVRNGPQQRVAAPFTVDGVLAGRGGERATATPPAV